MKINYLDRDHYNYKELYNREMRVPTISEIHSLYLRTLNRHNLLTKEIDILVEKIKESFVPNERGSIIVYYDNTKKNNRNGQSVFRIKPIDNYYKISLDYVSESRDITTKRDNRLSNLLSDNSIGNELYRLLRVRSDYKDSIFYSLERVIEDFFRKKYKDLVPPRVTEISIDGYLYYIVSNKNSYCYSYELVEKNSDIIDL